VLARRTKAHRGREPGLSWKISSKAIDGLVCLYEAGRQARTVSLSPTLLLLPEWMTVPAASGPEFPGVKVIAGMTTVKVMAEKLS